MNTQCFELYRVDSPYCIESHAELLQNIHAESLTDYNFPSSQTLKKSAKTKAITAVWYKSNNKIKRIIFLKNHTEDVEHESEKHFNKNLDKSRLSNVCLKSLVQIDAMFEQRGV